MMILDDSTKTSLVYGVRSSVHMGGEVSWSRRLNKTLNDTQDVEILRFSPWLLCLSKECLIVDAQS